MTDDLDAKIATIEAELGLDLSGTGNEVIDAELPQEAAIPPTGEAAPPAADSTERESAAGTIREYLDERDRRIDLERRVREAEARLPQQQPYQPDPYMDPHGFANARINEQLAPLRAVVQQQVIRNQVGEARAAHGADLIKKAADEFDAAAPSMPQYEWQAVMQSANPYLAAVD
jgi:hypothetical protein